MRVWVDDAAIGQRAGYIYCLYAPALRMAYVGQTCSGLGALGRLAQHLSDGSSNTFRQRLAVYCGTEADIGPVAMFAHRLSGSPLFHREAADQREAVEGLAAYDLITAIHQREIGVALISNVRFNRYTRLQYVRDASARCVRQMSAWLQSEVEKTV